ncbi:MAG: hypothetical protein GY790_04375 [Bacteroidetes bacterium]|nr:hypothetical protein [Bacteroidota bacterium]
MTGKTSHLLYAMLLCAALSFHSGSINAQEQFTNPPPAARPGVLWDWMGGLISREGITKDLEAMATQGIGKVMIMQMPDQCPYPRQWSYRDYPGKVKILSDEWFDIMNYTIGECDRLGIEIGAFTCPGWGHVGGPWVPEEKGTKKMAVSRVSVSGPVLFEGELPRPAPAPVVSGGNLIPEWNHAFGLLPEAKENFFRDEAILAFPAAGRGGVVALDEVIDLTRHLDGEGKLSWEVPAGDWTIYRVCLVSENGVNHPAPPESIGLEVDRMDPEAVRIVFDNMIGRILREARAKGYQSFTSFETDSYETGWQDFGLDYIKEFERRRGYDCTRWLPAWNFQYSDIQKCDTGAKVGSEGPAIPLIIESAELTERFRRDMLRTISELWTERFQGTLRKLADENGIEWMTEPYFKIPLEWTTAGGRSTMPGAEFWVGEGGDFGQYVGNAPEIAAVNDRRIAWAEAFTAESYNSAWRNDPWILKRSGDMAFSHGINLFYMHGFVHNPFPDKYQPGLTMGYWGTQLSRHQTWWAFSRPWHQYLARCQYMLQQGDPVFQALRYPADFDPNPVTLHGQYRSAQLTDEVLLNKLSVHGGKLVLPHGAEFNALYLTGGALRPDALEKIRDMVEAGAVVIGNPPPMVSASLENYPECDMEIIRLVDELWGGGPVDKAPYVRSLGKGKVISGMSLEEGMREIGKLPDLTWKSLPGEPRADLRWYQRTTGDEVFWFVSNHGFDPVEVKASFELSGLQPEWWDPVDGSWRELPEFQFENGRTIIPLSFESLQSGFVVFRKKAEVQGQEQGTNFPRLESVMEVQGPWKVAFDPLWGGAEDPVSFSHLSDWSANEDMGIRYYSGTAVYRVNLDAPSGVRKASGPVFLDLGEVHNLARVKLNGRELGTVWCAPWRVSIPKGLLKKKENELEIAVVNTWVNRLIGDEQEPDDFETEPGNQTGDRLGSYDIKVKSRGLKELPHWLLNEEPRPSQGRYTFTSWFYYDKDAPLRPAGLLGPVRIMESAIQN